MERPCIPGRRLRGEAIDDRGWPFPVQRSLRPGIRIVHNRDMADEETSPAVGISAREAEVLAALGEHLTNAEIGARLFISTKTAGNHVSSILSKLNLRSRAEAAAFAAQHGAR
jgi:DNA-binding NarL/FixJ family response regulator